MERVASDPVRAPIRAGEVPEGAFWPADVDWKRAFCTRMRATGVRGTGRRAARLSAPAPETTRFDSIFDVRMEEMMEWKG